MAHDEIGFTYHDYTLMMSAMHGCMFLTKRTDPHWYRDPNKTPVIKRIEGIYSDLANQKIFTSTFANFEALLYALSLGLHVIKNLPLNKKKSYYKLISKVTILCLQSTTNKKTKVDLLSDVMMHNYHHLLYY